MPPSDDPMADSPRGGRTRPLGPRPGDCHSNVSLTAVKVVSTPIVSGDRVFVSSWGHLQAFDRKTGEPLFVVGQL